MGDAPPSEAAAAPRAVPFSADIDLGGFIPPLPPGPPPPRSARASPMPVPSALVQAPPMVQPSPLPSPPPPPPPPPPPEEDDETAPPPPDSPPETPPPPAQEEEEESGAEDSMRTPAPRSPSSSFSINVPQLPPERESSQSSSWSQPPSPSHGQSAATSGRPSPAPQTSAPKSSLTVRTSPVVGTTPPPPGAHSPLPHGSRAPSAVRRPVAVAPAAGSSGKYQSLSASFGESMEPQRSPQRSPSSSIHSFASKASPAKGSHSHNMSISSTSMSSNNGGPTAAAAAGAGRNRSGSIDRLTGRVPPAASSSAPILKADWLKKEGEGVLGGYKKRWCVLSSRAIEFLKDPSDDREKCLGTLVLPGASVFAMEDEKLEFHVLPVSGKKVSFRARDENERNTWVALLLELTAVPESLLSAVFDSDSYTEWSRDEIHSVLLPALTRLLSKVGIMSSVWGVGDRSSVGVLLSGFLTKMGDKVRNFKRRYFVLIGSVLMYFDSEESFMLTDTGSANGGGGGGGNGGGGGAGEEQQAAAAGSATASADSALVPPALAQPNTAVLGSGAPSAPRPDSASGAAGASGSKSAHGKEVFASLARTHMRAQRRSITPIDLQNHHLLRRTSTMPFGGGGAMGGGMGGPNGAGGAAGAASASGAAGSAALIKKALKGEGRPALGLIPLRDCSLLIEGAPARPHGFSLQTRDRKYMLYADNEEELRAWFFVLNHLSIALPIRGYMKEVLEGEMRADKEREEKDGATTSSSSPAGSGSPNGGASVHRAPALLSDANLSLLKKQLSSTLLDPTCHRYLRNYWLERQSFHEVRTYPTLFPLDTPLSLVTERGRSFFQGLLNDEAGAQGENALAVPLHYLSFWMEVENWASLKAPTRAGGEGGGEDSNEFASPQDPSFVHACIPLPLSYRQARAEEIIDKYLCHGAPYPVYVDQAVRDDILASSLRGTSAPNKVAPLSSLFSRAQELVTEVLALEVFPRYLRSPGSNWGFLRSLQSKYDESLLLNRAALLTPQLLERPYDADTYEDLSQEEKDAEEDARLARFDNLVSRSPEEVDSISLECAEQFGRLPNTDPTKLLYHNYLYALQRLREYHALFPQSNPNAAEEHAQQHAHQPQLSLPYKQQTAAKTFYHDFLSSGSPWALCIPSKLVRPLRSRLMHVGDSPRSQYLFMDVECVLLTELRFGMEEASAKVKQQVANQRQPFKKASIIMGGVPASLFVPAKAKTPSPTYGKRRSIIAHPLLAKLPPLPAPALGASAAATAAATAAAAASSTSAASATAGIAIPPLPSLGGASSSPPDPNEVPFNMIFGVSSLFSFFKRFSLTCRHANPQYLWDQLDLVSRLIDYRSLSDAKVMQLYARQVYAQYLADAAPHKVNLSRGVADQLKVSVSQASPGPHCFMAVLREVYRSIEGLYNSAFKPFCNSNANGGTETGPAVATAQLYSCMQEEFGLWLRSEICVTQGRRDAGGLDAGVSLLQNNKNASTWFDMLDPHLKDADESLVNLSAHQSLWTAHFKQFLVERFCSENAIFYAEADDYRRVPGPSYRLLKAKRLYEHYISDQAQLQVNVPSAVARELTALLHPRDDDATVSGGTNGSSTSRPSIAAGASSSASASSSSSSSDLTASSPLLFIVAQREIFLLIAADSLKPFLDSQHYRNYKLACQAKVTW